MIKCRVNGTLVSRDEDGYRFLKQEVVESLADFSEYDYATLIQETEDSVEDFLTLCYLCDPFFEIYSLEGLTRGEALSIVNFENLLKYGVDRDPRLIEEEEERVGSLI